MTEEPGVRLRALFALAGIGVACLLVSLFCLSFSFTDFTLSIYALIVAAGGVLVGIPIVMVPSRYYERLPWPVAILGGAALGPIALVLTFVAIALLQGSLRSFSLPYLGLGWPFSVLASTSAVCVYVELVKRSLTGRGTVRR